MKFIPRDYQKPAIASLVNHKYHALFADVGAGKTPMIIEGMKQVDGPWLIVAPLRVCYLVWTAEMNKWSDFVPTIVHSQSTYKAAEKRAKAMDNRTDHLVINPEGLPWLFENYDLKGYNLCIDESHQFKNPSGKRFKLLKKYINKFERRWIMTASPATRNCLDLWSQLFLVDKGEKLGINVTRFRKEYAYRGGYMGREWKPFPNSSERITEATKDIVHRVEVEIEDNRIENDIIVDLPKKAAEIYKKAENQLRIELANESEKITESAVAAYILCRQIANGGMYDDDKVPHNIHDQKIEAVTEIIDARQGKGTLIFYHFKHDKDRIRKAYPKASFIDGETKAKDTPKLVEAFGSGEISELWCHPQAAGTGLDGLQHNCDHVVWMGMPDDFGLYLQGNGRVAGHRAGGKVVTISRIIANNTVDRVIAARIGDKDTGQRSILDAYRE